MAYDLAVREPAPVLHLRIRKEDRNSRQFLFQLFHGDCRGPLLDHVVTVRADPDTRRDPTHDLFTVSGVLPEVVLHDILEHLPAFGLDLYNKVRIASIDEYFPADPRA